MLIISYGIPKSGSTLAYELLRGMLANAGFAQEFARAAKTTAAPPRRGARRNFVARLTREKIEELVGAIGPDGRIAIKTHDDFDPALFGWLEDMQRRGDIQVIASYRDPRDICLSLLDAAERARAREDGPKAFSHVQDLEHAAEKVGRRLEEFRRWAALKGTLRIDYEELAFDTGKVIDRLERTLGIVCNREQVMRYTFSEALTQKNKAKPRRHEDELDDAQKKIMRREFRSFLRNVCEEDNQEWFDTYREKMLRGV
jgi:hypothetical protein